MPFRNRMKFILLILLSGGFLVPSLGIAIPALAQEPDVDISVAYGWWQVVTRPDTRLLISKNRLYEEWKPHNRNIPFEFQWVLSEGRFVKLAKNRYLFIADSTAAHPGLSPKQYVCRFFEFQLYPSDLDEPPKRMEISIEYHEFYDKKKGLKGSCGGPPAYWPDWVLRKKLAKQK